MVMHSGNIQILWQIAIFGLLLCCVDSILCDNLRFSNCQKKLHESGAQTFAVKHLLGTPQLKRTHAYSRPSKFDRQTWRNPPPKRSDAREIAAVSGAVGYDDIGVQRKNLGGCWYMM